MNISTLQEVGKSRLSPKLLAGILVALVFAVALCLRVCLPYDKVFTTDWITFTGVDAYYHMRLVDNLVHNFPHLLSFDPYFIYPDGIGVVGGHFFDRLLASIIWLVGLGSPTQHTIDVVGVYFPAVLGALTVIPVYFIGKELFNRWVGVIAAGLLAVLPGEFLGRSILGFTDHHVAETLFTTVTMLFLILAIKAASQRQLTFGHLRHRDWAAFTKPIIYSLVAGIFLGMYLLTFLGGLLFVFIISVYFIIQFISDHLRHKSTDYLCLVGVGLFFIAAIMFLPVSRGMLHLVSMYGALLIPLVLSGISWLMARRKIRPVYYPLTLVGLGLAGLAVFYVIAPSLLGSMLGTFKLFMPTGAQLTTIEMQPLFFPGGSFSFAVAWGNFNITFFLGIISLGMLIYLIVRRGNAGKSLLVVWSLVILAATLGQRRFAYYLAVNVALLTGYLSVLVYYVIRFIIDHLREARTDYMSWQVLEFTGFEELMTRPSELSTRAERRRARLKKRQEARFRPTIIHTSISLWVIVVFFVVFFPHIAPAITTADRAQFAPSDAWVSSLSWMKENTPEPLGDPDLYYQLETSHEYRSLYWLKRNVPNPSGDPDFYYQLEENRGYPESAYGVIAWWDYGYWISRIAHRIPNANPSQATGPVTSVASFFISQDEESAGEIREELGSSYVIIDYEVAVPLFYQGVVAGKFYAVATWAGRDQTEFLDFYYLRQENQLMPVLLYYPEYYRSLSTRLYNFDGEAVTPEVTWVISYEEMVSQEGIPLKVITGEEQFDSYEEAEAHISSQESANYEIVSSNPLISPVPLEALEHYRLIHSSDTSITLPDESIVPAVKIFEYLD